MSFMCASALRIVALLVGCHGHCGISRQGNLNVPAIGSGAETAKRYRNNNENNIIACVYLSAKDSQLSPYENCSKMSIT